MAKGIKYDGSVEEQVRQAVNREKARAAAAAPPPERTEEPTPPPVQRPPVHQPAEQTEPAPAAVPKSIADTGGQGEEHPDYKELPKIYINILGGTGTGKTTFLGGMVSALLDRAVVLSGNIKGEEAQLSVSLQFIEFISTRNALSITRMKQAADARATADAGMLAKELNKLSLVRTEGRKTDNERTIAHFPDSTEGITMQFVFALLLDSMPVAKVIFTDFKGELIDDPQDNAQSRELEKSCAESDAIIFMADAKKLLEHYANGNLNRTLVQKDLHTRTLDTMFQKIIIYAPGRKIPTLFAVTKTDMPSLQQRANLAANNFTRLCSDVTDVYSSIIQTVRDHKWPYGIIPVTACGNGTTDEENELFEDADPRQNNIDTAVLFCISQVLDRVVRELKDLQKNSFVSMFRGKERKNARMSYKSVKQRIERAKLFSVLLANNPGRFVDAMPVNGNLGVDGIRNA